MKSTSDDTCDIRRRLTMEIHDNFQPIGLCPRDSFREVRKLPLNIRLPSRHVKCPISNGQSYVIKPMIRFISVNASILHDMDAKPAHPAAAIAAKSDSVIQVFQ